VSALVIAHVSTLSVSSSRFIRNSAPPTSYEAYQGKYGLATKILNLFEMLSKNPLYHQPHFREPRTPEARSFREDVF